MLRALSPSRRRWLGGGLETGVAFARQQADRIREPLYLGLTGRYALLGFAKVALDRRNGLGHLLLACGKLTYGRPQIFKIADRRTSLSWTSGTLSWKLVGAPRLRVVSKPCQGNACSD
jgi:hypothetical protein